MTLPIIRAFLVALVGSIAASILAVPEVRGWRAWALVGVSCALWLEAIIESWLPARKVEWILKPPEPEPQMIRNLLQVDKAVWIYEDILPPSKLRRLAIGLLLGRPFSYREWQGELPEIRRVQDEFERRGLVYIKGKRRILNDDGRRAMLDAINQNKPLPPPLPEA